MQKITVSVTNPTIHEIYSNIVDNRLDLAPIFQRKFVWTQAHQEQFIETIQKGLPFPEIYIAEGEFDYTEMKPSQIVVDGQQRLTTIKNYIDGKINNCKIIKDYNNLTEDEKRIFVSYQLVVRNLGNIDDTTIREIFRRINLTKFKLEDIEIHNAVYDGQFIQSAKELLDILTSQGFELEEVFHQSELTRMADLHFILMVLSTLEKGYFNLDKELERCIAEFNEEYPSKEDRKEKIIDSFNVIKNLELNQDSIWYRKSNFFTLIVELSLATKYPENLKDRLLEFEKNILDNRTDKTNDFGKYYSYMYSGTNARGARVTRSELLKKYVLN